VRLLKVLKRAESRDFRINVDQANEMIEDGEDDDSYVNVARILFIPYPSLSAKHLPQSCHEVHLLKLKLLLCQFYALAMHTPAFPTPPACRQMDGTPARKRKGAGNAPASGSKRKKDHTPNVDDADDDETEEMDGGAQFLDDEAGGSDDDEEEDEMEE
jgi:hypothetical protein